LVLRKTFLAFPTVRWPLSRPELNDVVVNLFGFVPLGVLFYRYRRLVVGSKMRSAIILTTLTGAMLSLTIETGQAWLPARDSTLADVALNTAGMLVGACLAAGTASSGKRY
jgi:glycopeptide antibiotics resistance protein